MTDEPLISDEDLRAILYAGNANTTLQRALDQQNKQAEFLRKDSGAPEGQMISGRYVAPHFLQYAGNLAKQYAASKFDKQAQGTGAQMDANTQSQNQAILAALLRNQRMGTGAQTMPQRPSLAGPAMLGQPGY